jgi:hypothetical protein
MHHRFRRQQQNHKGGDGHRAQGQHRPVEHDAHEHNGDHDERALRGHLGAGQDQIKRGYQERAGRRPFFDRHAVGKSRDQRQQRAQDEEDDAGDDRHVIAGDRLEASAAIVTPNLSRLFLVTGGKNPHGKQRGSVQWRRRDRRRGWKRRS